MVIDETKLSNGLTYQRETIMLLAEMNAMQYWGDIAKRRHGYDEDPESEIRRKCLREMRDLDKRLWERSVKISLELGIDLSR